MMGKEKKIICFDLDGTLIAADELHARAYHSAFRKHHLRFIPTRTLMGKFGLEKYRVIRFFYPSLSRPQIRKIEQEVTRFILQTHTKVKPIPGAKKTLAILKKDFTLAIVSNCTRNVILHLLSLAKIPRRYFQLIIGNDDVRHGKPAPDELFKAEKLLHHHVDYMIGDTMYDVLAGKKAKVKVIAVLSGRHTKKQLQKYEPEAIIPSVRTLPKYLASRDL